MKSVEYRRARTVEEALSWKVELPEALWLAGGTDLLVKLKAGTARPRALIGLRGVRDLAGIAEHEAATAIGALTPVAEIAAHPAVRRRHEVLAQAAALLGTPQVRNAATVGGNLCNCSPCADSAPPLVVLEAHARVEGPTGPREVPIEDLARGPGTTDLRPDELLTRIIVPTASPAARALFVKKRRTAVDLSLASVAVLLELGEDGRVERARAAAGSVAPVPLRLRAAEAALEGQRPTPEVAARARAAARDEVSPISDLRASADYRRHVTGVLLERAVLALADGRAS